MGVKFVFVLIVWYTDAIYIICSSESAMYLA